ncbi:RICIN domain-containing protein [Micromonospora sp. KC606]|uniref:RICIN domain-containing protein n=1 Tax=Micromonospora sp. KC606 TaxID=2530379 RepID=UPI001FB7C884|nr:RICIN domain-containing protein [Micromonospora sp. KC606]
MVLSGNYGSTTLGSLPSLNVDSISRTSSTALTFTASANGSTVNLIPFYDAHGHNYTVYWYASTAPSGYVNRNRYSGKVLEVYQRSTADGAAVVQWTDNGGADQQWTMLIG